MHSVTRSSPTDGLPAMLADRIATPAPLPGFVRRMGCRRRRLYADRMNSLLCQGGSCSGSLPIAEGMPENATCLDDAWKQLVVCHVKRRVEGMCAFCSNALAHEGQDLLLVTLFYGDLGARSNREIEGAQRCRRVERQPVVLGQDRQLVGPNLVGEVTVRGDAIGAYDDLGDHSMRHHKAGHSVSNKMERYTCGHEFQSCQACSLKVRPRLESNDLDLPALLERFVDRTKRCTISIGRKSAGIADGHDGISVFEQFGTVLR